MAWQLPYRVCGRRMTPRGAALSAKGWWQLAAEEGGGRYLATVHGLLVGNIGPFDPRREPCRML